MKTILAALLMVSSLLNAADADEARKDKPAHTRRAVPPFIKKAFKGILGEPGNEERVVRKSIIKKKELRYFHVQMQYVGDYLGRKFPGESILLITAPVTKHTGARNAVLLKRLREGLAGRLKICHQTAPKMPEDADDELLMYEYFFTAEMFEKMTAESDCTLILSLIGLPFDFEEMKFWELEEKDRPKLVLVNGNIFNLKKAIKFDFVNAVVHYKPNLRYDINEKVPDDYKEAFAKRYIIIDKHNIKAMVDKYPNLFKPDDDDEDDDN